MTCVEITPALWETLPGTTFRSNALAWAALPDGRRLLVSGSDNGYSHLWNIDTGEPAQLFVQHDDWVLSTACAALPTGQLLVATAERTGCCGCGERAAAANCGGWHTMER